MVEGCLTLLASTFGYLASGFHTLDRGTNLLDGGVPYYGVFEPSDRQYVSIGALEPQFFARLVDLLVLDPDWNAERIDKVRCPDLKAPLGATFRAHEREPWTALPGDDDVCFAPVLYPIEAPAPRPERRR